LNLSLHAENSDQSNSSHRQDLGSPIPNDQRYAMHVEGRWALVTGASSGLGVEFAELLAQRKMNVVITARREDRLEAIASKLRKQYQVNVLVLPGDLRSPEMCTRLFDATERQNIEIDVLINNAGFGTQGSFINTEWNHVDSQLQLNMVSLTHLTWLWSKQMVKRGRGRIMNVASINAYMAIPNYATYAAGKAYVRNFTLAVAEELRGSGVHITSLCPGPTATEFIDVAGHTLAPWQRKFLMDPRQCARIGINALFSTSTNTVVGWSNKAMITSLRLLPAQIITRLAERVMR